MKRLGLTTAMAVLALAFALTVSPATATAHEQENFVDWTVAYDNLEFREAPAPVFTAEGQSPVTGRVNAQGQYPRIELDTGDQLTVVFGFDYIGDRVRRGDLFWVTRLGLDFGTIGKYIDDGTGRVWLGGGSFELVPGTSYTATLVLGAIQPTFRHLHVGVSVQDVGNIPAAPTVSPIPNGGPTLYGVFTQATGAVVEPLEGMNIQPFGTLKLIEPWPWAVAGLAAQILLGIGFIIVMYWYGRWEAKRAPKGGA
jgi:hypothetical protein